MEKKQENLTVREILNMPGFQEMKILAGEKGLDNLVTNVSVMDAPDIYKWMKGGEILLTTAYIMKDDPQELKDLIIHLKEVGTASLSIKLERFIDELPKEIIETANELDFPILTMPQNFAFTDVIKPVLTKIINKQAENLLISERIHESFTQISIQEGGTKEVIDTLSEIINRNVAFWDNFTNELVGNGETENIFEGNDEEKIWDLKKNFSSHKVEISKMVTGYFFIDGDIGEIEEDIYCLTAIEHASTVIKFDIQKKISNYQIENRYREQFVKDIIYNNFKNEKEIKNRGKLYGWEFKDQFIAVVIDIDNYNSKFQHVENEEKKSIMEFNRWEILKKFREKFRKEFNFVIWTAFTSFFVFLIEFEEFNEGFIEKVTKESNALNLEINKERDFTVTVGIGDLESSILEAEKSYIKATKAVELGRSIWGLGKTILYKDLGVFVLLEEIYSTQKARDFIYKYLGEVIKFDEKKDSELLFTLDKIVVCDWNLKKASEELHLHYNTIKYRYQKICDLNRTTNLSGEQKTCINIALKLLKMGQENGL